MWIQDQKPDATRAKEVKVKIPVGHHVKLHSIKVLTGKAISDAVTEALDAYFAAHRFDDAVVSDAQAWAAGHGAGLLDGADGSALR